MTEKQKKEKPAYSLFQNAGYVIRDNWKWKPSLVLVALLFIPLHVIVPLLIALVPKIIIDIIEAGGGASKLMLVIPFLVAGMVLVYIAERVTKLYTEDAGIRSRFRYQVAMDVKTMEMDYEYMASNKGKNQKEKALKMVMESGAALFYLDLVLLVSNTLGLVSYASVLALLDPIILVVLAISYVITWLVSRYVNRYVESQRDEQAEHFKGLRYLIRKAMDLAGAKDIRLYGIQGWFKEVGEDLLHREDKLLKDVAKRQIASSAVSALLIFVRDGIAYALLISKVLSGVVSVSNFLVYFTMIATFADWISGLITAYNHADLESSGFCYYRDYINMPSASKQGGSLSLPERAQWPCDLELRDVCYTYEESDTPTLSHVNLKIKAGERIALVGLNGAGKTTLVKLICGLFTPTSGQILINGQDAAQFNRAEYFKLFSVIFQDIHLLPVSIATNITLVKESEQNEERLEKCLRLSGLADKVKQLPKGKNTLLVKNVNEDAYELSGGEMQKLLLARALYKEAPMLILDEPTAALDPIAENELYLQYRDMTKDRTSIFISHRFASTRFCDRIVLLENGQIAEEGSHETLMEKGGRYAELFRVQSQYYQEGGEKNE